MCLGDGLWALAVAVIVLTWVNARGIHASASAQSWLTLAGVLGLVLVVVAGLWLWGDAGHTMPVATAGEGAGGGSAAPALGMLGLAMVFVLLTFGGWNEAAYPSAELRGSRRGTLHAGEVAAGAGGQRRGAGLFLAPLGHRRLRLLQGRAGLGQCRRCVLVGIRRLGAANRLDRRVQFRRGRWQAGAAGHQQDRYGNEDIQRTTELCEAWAHIGVAGPGTSAVIVGSER